jgi:hypothetical protein
MAVSYASIEADKLASQKAQQAVNDEARIRAANEYIHKMSESIDTAAQSKIQKSNAEKAAIPSQYQAIYDANAVQELVSKRQLEERMANMGLTDSGLNRTQQTAIAVQRGKSDEAARTKQQAAVDTINRSIAQYMAEADAEKQSMSAAALNKAYADNAADSYQAALSNAMSLYKLLVAAEKS